MGKINKSVLKMFARFYNPMPKKLKIGIMVCISVIGASFTKLFMDDLNEINGTLTNEYLKNLINGLLPLFTIIYNLLQESAVDNGTKLLALERDIPTLNKLQEKIEKTVEIRDVSI